jgi:hypothetical protein
LRLSRTMANNVEGTARLLLRMLDHYATLCPENLCTG